MQQPLVPYGAVTVMQSMENTRLGTAPETTVLLSRLIREIIVVGKIDVQDSLFVGPVFAATCCGFSFLFIVLDICIFFIRKRSIFQLEYRFRHAVGLMIAVPVAASIVGLLGFFLDLLQPTRAAGIAIGVAWPVFLTAFFNAKEAMSRDEDTDAGGEALA